MSSHQYASCTERSIRLFRSITVSCCGIKYDQNHSGASCSWMKLTTTTCTSLHKLNGSQQSSISLIWWKKLCPRLKHQQHHLLLQMLHHHRHHHQQNRQQQQLHHHHNIYIYTHTHTQGKCYNKRFSHEIVIKLTIKPILFSLPNWWFSSNAVVRLVFTLKR